MSRLANWQLFAVCVVVWGTTGMPSPADRRSRAGDRRGAALRAGRRHGAGLRGLARHAAALSRARPCALRAAGAFMYGVSYVCVYHAEQHVVSGLVAVGYSASPLIVSLGARAAFGAPLSGRFIAGGVVGLIGVTLIFWPEIAKAPAGASSTLGAIFTVGAVLLSAVGSLSASRRNRHHGLPFWPALGFGMLWGALASVLLAAALGRPWSLPLNAGWWISLGYLAIAGSVITFACYLTLQDRLGPGPAGTIGVMTPLLALIVSLLFEGYRPEPITFIGAALAVAGNVAMLRARRGGKGMNSVSPGTFGKR
ncbi:DMT family transporter [Piscinibacter aquaticus]|uniref:DMT family transporter n=1 Tax=Piscinibacter aquaticus TaxID=392597 RepID=A0A5C6TXY6_9BURK|nr:DMT family transporter [Piscinibacter aquaticus]